MYQVTEEMFYNSTGYGVFDMIVCHFNRCTFSTKIYEQSTEADNYISVHKGKLSTKSQPFWEHDKAKNIWQTPQASKPTSVLPPLQINREKKKHVRH